MGLGIFADTVREREELATAYLNDLAESTRERLGVTLPSLKSLLSSQLEGGEEAHDLACTALVGDQLAVRLFPELFAKRDADGLVPLTDLESVLPGVYRIGELVVFAHPYFRRSLSRLNFLNAELLRELERFANHEGVGVRIRLDPDAVGLASTAKEPIEFEYCYGPKFRDNLSDITPGVTRHDANQTQLLFDAISRTEFWWQSRLNKDKEEREHILEIEELRDRETFGNRSLSWGCRYVHSMVNEATGNIEHLDGAVREYADSEFLVRIETDITKAGRHTRYTKLWRVDGSLPLSAWKTLIYYHFRNNSLVGEYLDGRKDACNAEFTESTVTQTPLGSTVSVSDSYSDLHDLVACNR